ncbi:MAG: MerR family transcriptional regulator [Pseudomonadota bacterium]|nr:MerR family transcriptional regulator [Pseudomonadota bacterium]
MATLGNLHATRIEPEVHSEAAVNNGKRESTIGEMAAEFNVSLRTLRFYEDRKLLKPRREGNSRLYSATDRLRMQMIMKGKQLGFTLTEIHDLIGNYETTDDFEGKLKPQQIVTQIDHLERQRAEIDGAIARLRATHERLAAAYPIVRETRAASA